MKVTCVSLPASLLLASPMPCKRNLMLLLGVYFHALSPYAACLFTLCILNASTLCICFTKEIHLPNSLVPSEEKGYWSCLCVLVTLHLSIKFFQVLKVHFILQHLGLLPLSLSRIPFVKFDNVHTQLL